MTAQYFSEAVIQGDIGIGPQYHQVLSVYADKAPMDFVSVDSSDFDTGGRQAVVTDGTYIYTSGKIGAGDSTDDFYIYKWDDEWNLVDQWYVQSDIPGTGTQINGMKFHDGSLWITVNSHGNGMDSWVMERDEVTLDFIDTYPVEAFNAEGLDRYNGFWWIVYNDASIVSQYNDTWQLINTHSIPNIPETNKSQGIMFIGDIAYITIHEISTPQSDLPNRTERHLWNGTGFTKLSDINPPEPFCGQGLALSPDGNYTLWSARYWEHNNDHRVIKATFKNSKNTIGLNKKAKNDFGDVRVTNSDGTQIWAGDNNGWMDDKTDGVVATIHFDALDNLSSDRKLRVYYGDDNQSWSDDFIPIYGLDENTQTLNFVEQLNGSSNIVITVHDDLIAKGSGLYIPNKIPTGNIESSGVLINDRWITQNGLELPIKNIIDTGPLLDSVIGSPTTQYIEDVGLAIANDGTDTNAVEHTGNFAVEYPFTVACWMISNSGSTQQSSIVSFSDRSRSARQIAFAICIAGDNSDAGTNINLINRNPVWDGVTGPTIVSNEKYRLLATFVSGSLAEFWVNGVSQGTHTASVNNAADIDSVTALRLGDITPNWGFDGAVWDISHWGKELTEIEIIEDYLNTYNSITTLG